MLPSHTELEYFVEVSYSLNFSRASERLGISQPSLSMAMQRLEKSIGASLFIRHKQGVTLTQAGKQLLLHVRQLMQYWDATKSQALASQEEVQGSFTLGCHSTMISHILGGALSELLEKYPQLDIHLVHDVSRKTTEEVINLSIDIGIVANPIRHPDLIIIALCRDEVGFWVSAGKRKIQDIHAEEAVILCDPELTQTQSLLKKSKKAGLISERIMAIPSLEAVASLTVEGVGIGILPARVVASTYPGKLKPISQLPIYADELCLVYRHEYRHVKAIQTIVNVIKNHIKHNHRT